MPSLLKARSVSEVKYQNYMKSILGYAVLCALIISGLMTSFGSILIDALYGDEYKEAANVLRIHIWSSVFVFMGVLGNCWYIAESKQRYLLFCTVVGAFSNILLNFLLIPRYGVQGAAFSTLISQLFSAYALDFMNDKTRVLFKMKTNALFLNFISI